MMMTFRHMTPMDQQPQASSSENHDYESYGDIQHDTYGNNGGDTSGLSDFAQDSGSHNFGGHDLHQFSQPFATHQHVDIEDPEPIKHYKEVVVPVPKNVEFKINQPVIIPVPHPVPIHIPIAKAVVVPVEKEISIPVEKSVPYKVEKNVYVPKIVSVPFEVVKHTIVTVEKPVPFKVPVHETIIHSKKGSFKI